MAADLQIIGCKAILNKIFRLFKMRKARGSMADAFNKDQVILQVEAVDFIHESLNINLEEVVGDDLSLKSVSQWDALRFRTRGGVMPQNLLFRSGEDGIANVTGNGIDWENECLPTVTLNFESDEHSVLFAIKEVKCNCNDAVYGVHDRCNIAYDR